MKYYIINYKLFIIIIFIFQTLNEEELNISINTENDFLRAELENIKKQLEVAVANNKMLLQRQQPLQQPQPPSLPQPAQPQIPAPQQPATLQMIPPQLASSQEKSDEQILSKLLNKNNVNKFK